MRPEPGTTEAAIFNAVCETFESLAFEEVILESVSDTGEAKAEEGFWWAGIGFINPPMGELYLVIKHDLLIRFTDAVLGLLGEQPTEPQIADNLGELLNTFCGRMVALLSPPDTTLELGLPEIGKTGCLPAHGQYRFVKFLVGDYSIQLLVPKAFWSMPASKTNVQVETDD
jgi:hypothetical protein